MAQILLDFDCVANTKILRVIIRQTGKSITNCFFTFTPIFFANVSKSHSHSMVWSLGQHQKKIKLLLQSRIFLLKKHWEDTIFQDKNSYPISIKLHKEVRMVANMTSFILVFLFELAICWGPYIKYNQSLEGRRFGRFRSPLV